MKTISLMRRYVMGCVLGLSLTMVSVAPGFPPAPHHTIYGQVRDEFGDPLDFPDIQVILQTGSGATITTFVNTNLEPGVNFRLEVPMDSGISSDLYRPTALKPTLPFTLRVKINNAVYLPMEMTGNFKNIGKPGESTRLNLTLGEDADGDGLPDAWERALIALLGGNLTLASITPNGDDDHDGISNLNEYLAGTYAFDPSDGFRLNIVRLNGTAPVMQFTALPGRTYTVLSSTNLTSWDAARFRIPAGASPTTLQTEYQSSDVRLMEIEAEPQAGTKSRFFKLIVQ